MASNGTSERLGNANKPFHVKVKEGRWTILSVLAAFSALAVSAFTLLFTLSPWGNVHAIEPSSYAIIRQDTLGSPGIFTTREHLVLPIEWKNNNGSSALISRLVLYVSERNGDGETHEFNLVKEYPQLSGPAFEEDYAFRNSLTLEPHSISSRVLSFRTAEPSFQLDPFTEYEARIQFLKNNSDTPEERPQSDEQGWRFCTYNNRNSQMIHTGDVQWNWWLFEEARDESCQGE